MIGKAGKRLRMPQRKCIFCGEGGTPGNKMSEEHIWPEWMHPSLLPHISSTNTTAGRFRMRLSGVITESKTRQGRIFTKRYKLVCQNCNSRWMSGLETDVKPILLPLLEGDRFVLLRKNRRILSSWLALKLMLTECIDPSDAVLTQSEREAFRLKKEIPCIIKIWIGTHNAPNWYSEYSHQTLLGNYGSVPAAAAECGGNLKNMQVTALGIGHIFALFYVSRIREIQMKPHGRIRSLWPIHQAALVWPLTELSGADCDKLALSLREVLKAPFARWVPYRG
jgi:hypothetical protein